MQYISLRKKHSFCSVINLSLLFFGIFFFAITHLVNAQYIVDNNLDSGSGSLRQAILDANTSQGTDTVIFDIAGSSISERTINLVTALPVISDTLIVDGTTQPNGGFFGNSNAKIAIDGNNGAFNGFESSAQFKLYGISISNFSLSGIVLQSSADNSEIGNINKGNYIYSNSLNGISVTADSVLIISNIIGSDTIGGIGNTEDGISIGGFNNTIGGLNPGERNIIMNNGSNGIQIDQGDNLEISGNIISNNQRGISSYHFQWGVGAYLSNIRITGNKIGTDSTGTMNIGNQQYGIALERCPGVHIGDTISQGRNIISGNALIGIYLRSCDSAIIKTNYIGTDITGTIDFGNTNAGIRISSSSNLIIGGLNYLERNLISGNGLGIQFSGDSSMIIGNYIGVASDNSALANDTYGIRVEGNYNSIGGLNSGEGNIIMNNGDNGIHIDQIVGLDISGNTISSNLRGIASYQFQWGTGEYLPEIIIRGNNIGTDSTGTINLGNQEYGIGLERCPGVRIGDTIISGRNTICNNGIDGIFLLSCDSAIIQANNIGTDVNGLQDFGNTNTGLRVTNSSYLLIGGTTAAAGNIISGNETGIRFTGDSTTFAGNKIGIDINGDNLPNDADGIVIGGNGNTIGGLNSSSGNIITNNGNCGIKIEQGDGLNIFGNTISANKNGISSYQFEWGLAIEIPNITIKGNKIGTDTSGTLIMSNTLNGIALEDCSDVIIGDSTSEGTNVISANESGVILRYCDNAVVSGNNIGVDINGTSDLGNSIVGLKVVSTTNITVGGTSVNEGNIISDNGTGIEIYEVINSRLYGNYIGCDRTGLINLGNSNAGVEIRGGSTNNIIGGYDVTFGNIIANNGYEAVRITNSSTLYNQVRKNSIFNNSQISGNGGISLLYGANNDKQGPAITTFNNSLIAGTSAPLDTIEIYRDTCILIEGAEFIDVGIADGAGDWSISGSFTDAYALTATDTLGNTSGFISASLADSMSISFTITDVMCNGMTNASIFANVSGGAPPYSYQWDNSGTNPMIDNLSVGSYAVTVTDSYSNTITGSASIAEPEPMLIDVQITNASSAIATDGSAEAIVTGGTPPYSYYWNTNETTPIINELGIGFYCVGVMDMNGCQDTACGTVSYGIGLNEMTVNENITVYPNPNNGDFTIEFSCKGSGANSKAGIEIFDITGSVIYEKSITISSDRHLEKVMSERLTHGLYFLSISIDGNRNIRKIVIE